MHLPLNIHAFEFEDSIASICAFVDLAIEQCLAFVQLRIFELICTFVQCVCLDLELDLQVGFLLRRELLHFERVVQHRMRGEVLLDVSVALTMQRTEQKKNEFVEIRELGKRFSICQCQTPNAKRQTLNPMPILNPICKLLH